MAVARSAIIYKNIPTLPIRYLKRLMSNYNIYFSILFYCLHTFFEFDSLNHETHLTRGLHLNSKTNTNPVVMIYRRKALPRLVPGYANFLSYKGCHLTSLIVESYSYHALTTKTS